MVPCKACGLLHSSMIRCEVAKNLLDRAGEKKSAQQEPVPVTSGSVLHTVSPPVVAAPKKVVKGVGRPRVYADPEARRKERQRAYMKKWRAKK